MAAHKFELNKAASRKFNKTFGKGAAKRFVKILWENGKLADVAREFEFSRTYASVLFKDLFEMDFTDYRKLRKEKLQAKAARKKVKNYKSLIDMVS